MGRMTRHTPFNIGIGISLKITNVLATTLATQGGSLNRDEHGTIGHWAGTVNKRGRDLILRGDNQRMSLAAAVNEKAN